MQTLETAQRNKAAVSRNLRASIVGVRGMFETSSNVLMVLLLRIGFANRWKKTIVIDTSLPHLDLGPAEIAIYGGITHGELKIITQ